MNTRYRKYLPFKHLAILSVAIGGQFLGTNCFATELPWERALSNKTGAEVTRGHGSQVQRDWGLAAHTGVDIAGVDIAGNKVCGRSVVAISPGSVVSRIQNDATLGWGVVVEDTDGMFSLYIHLEANSIPARIVGGAVVEEGEVLGRVGFTGAVEPPGEAGCHLHFERRNFASALPPAEGQCLAQLYQPWAARQTKCFLERWDDPNVPMIGEFDARAPRPPRYVESTTAGLDVGPENTNWTKEFRETYQQQNYTEDGLWLGRPASNHGGGNRVHLWARHGVNQLSKGVLIQDLKAIPPELGYQHGNSALIANTRLSKVFLIRTGFWNVYVNHGGPWNLGAPTSNESKVSGFVINGNVWEDEGSVQHFERGTLFYAPFLDQFYPTVEGIALIVNGQAAEIQQQVSILLSPAYIGYPWGALQLLIGGNPYCQMPCVDRALISDFIYEFKSPVGLAGVALGPSMSVAGVTQNGLMPDAVSGTTPTALLSEDGTTFAFPVANEPIDVLLTPGLVNTTLTMPDIDSNGIGDLTITYPSEVVIRYDYFDPLAHIDFIRDFYANGVLVTSVTGENFQGLGWNDEDLTEAEAVGHPWPGEPTGAMNAFIQIPATSLCSGLQLNRGVESSIGQWPTPDLVVETGRQLCVAVMPTVTMPDGTGDYDGDGLGDHFEACVLLSNPCDLDTNNNGVTDGEEYRRSLDVIFTEGFEVMESASSATFKY